MRRTLYSLLVALLLLTALGHRVRTRALPRLAAASQRHVTGAFHVHSASSHDSNVSLEAISIAARTAHLDFVVVTDHNKQLSEPVVLHDVTLLSYAELSTPQGHVVQLGVPRPIAAEVRKSPGLLAFIRQQGGRAVVSHPSDAKRPWVGSLTDAGGLEVANFAAAFRRRVLSVGVLPLIPALVAAPLHFELALTQVYDRDQSALRRWDAHPDPSFAGYCAADAHGRIDLATNLRFWRTVLDAPRPAAGAVSPELVIKALHDGRFHCVAGLLGDDPAFRFGARRNGDWVAGTGSSLSSHQLDELVVENPRAVAGRAQAVLLRDGREVMRTREPTLRYLNPPPGTYRAEILMALPNMYFDSRAVPVLYSNRIRVSSVAP